MAKCDIHQTILGKRSRIRTAKNLATRGSADRQDVPQKEIRISTELMGEELLEVLLHELQHAALWHLSETYVTESSRSIAAAIYNAGFRYYDQKKYLNPRVTDKRVRQGC